MKILPVLIFLVPALASGEPKAWLINEDPESLYISTFADPECPMSTEEVEQETKNVLIRSRLKPKQGDVLSDPLMFPFLKVSLQCMKTSVSDSVVVVSIKIEFMDVITRKSGQNAIARLGTGPYADSILTANKEFLRTILREGVEDFVADYKLAYLDLGEDE